MKDGRVVIGVLLALPAACVPRGDPPAGRQILADRQAGLIGLLPPTGDGVLRAFVARTTGQGPEGPVGDLFELSLDSTGDPATEKLLAPDIQLAESLGCTFNVAPCNGIDPRGVTVFPGAGPLERVDALTGAVQTFSGYPTFSQSKQRFFFGDQQGVALTDVSGQTTVLSDASTATARFVGDDFFYVTPQGDLMDVPLSDVPTQMATGLVDCRNAQYQNQPCTSFWGQATPDGIALVLHKQTPNPNDQGWSVRDPVTGLETWLPFDASYAQLSPDGRWLLEEQASADDPLTFFDYRDGVQQDFDVPYQEFSIPVWRPGTAELWMSVGLGSDTAAIWIVEPGKPAISISGSGLQWAGALDASERITPFTPDGVYWFSSANTPDTSMPVTQIGLADDPSGPRFDLDTPNTYLEPVRDFANGRVLDAVYTKPDDAETREDVSVFDPRTGASWLVGERGRIAAVGQTRVMGMFHWDEMRGDLTVADPATAQAIVLAPEFTVTAFAEPQGADQLAPGTRIVYQFQARTDSPYDGIWVANCP
ncbi:MAG TPA: hypothetical protein VMT03_15135 [Polyangia bacterium]|nr:hypothetical protein [Polyangia bacterium]